MLSMEETYKLAYFLALLLYAVSVIVQHDENLYFFKVVITQVVITTLADFKILFGDISESL